MLDDIRVLSLSPGRIRLKVQQLKRSPDLAAALRQRVADLPGVQRLDINPTTCSLLLLYDKQLFKKDDSVRALQQALTKQISAEERERLRATLASRERMDRWRQALTDALTAPEQERLHGMLHSLAGAVALDSPSAGQR